MLAVFETVSYGTETPMADADERIENLRKALAEIVDTLTGFESAEQSIAIFRAKNRAQGALDADCESASRKPR